MPPNGQALDRRLARILRDGNLTVADLSRVLERPYPTVRDWVNGTQIGGGALDAALVLAQIGRLEKRILKRDGLPVPRLSRADRIKHVEGLRR